MEQAIPSLIKLLGARKRDYPELEAVIAGGANMTLSHITDENKLVGKINSKLALEMIDKLDIDLKFQDIGGFEGRTILVESLEGNYQVKTIPRMSKGEGKNEIKSKAKDRFFGRSEEPEEAKEAKEKSSDTSVSFNVVNDFSSFQIKSLNTELEKLVVKR